MNTLTLLAFESVTLAGDWLPWIITMFIVGVIMVGIEMSCQDLAYLVLLAYRCLL